MDKLDLSGMMGNLTQSLGEVLPTLLTVIAILIIGWIVALIVGAVVRKLVGLLKVNQRLGGTTDVERIAGKVGFWVVMLITLVAVFSKLGLSEDSGPLGAMVGQVTEFLPKLISAGVLGLAGWIIATLARAGSTKALAATSLDEKLSGDAGSESFSANIGNILFGLVLLFFLPLVLGTLDLDGLLAPVQDMLGKILDMLPNVFAAGIIGFVGWLVAKILRGLTTSVLASTGVDRVGAKAGVGGQTSLSGMGGLIVYVMVFVPAIIAALNALGIDAISGPATAMLEKMMNAIPNIISAGVILAVTYFVARFVAMTVSLMLNGAGMDDLPAKLGFDLAGRVQPSIIVGKVILFFAMLFAVVEAAGMLGFDKVGEVVTMFIEFGGQVLLGAVILMVGFWLANLAHNTILQVSGADSAGLAKMVKFAIMGLVTAMGLGAMGIADNIVNLAFGLTLGAIAVAVALSFGLGGREAAGRQMEHWLSNMRK